MILKTALDRTIVTLLMLAITACGFELRGLADLSFKTLYIKGNNLSISKELQKALTVNGVTIVKDESRADLLMENLGEFNDKRILSLGGRVGVVREFELIYQVSFRFRDPASPTWGEVQTINGRRDFSYDDSEVLAKSFEEQRLVEDMRQDAVREIMRRLIVQKPSGRRASKPAPTKTQE